MSSNGEWTVASLRQFEEGIRQEFLAGRAKGAVHLSRGNESQLIEIFKDIKRTDHVFSTWRSHYHALLHGLPEALVRAEILAGNSINLNSAEHRFFTSSIVGGCLPIATGTALALKAIGSKERVWCFVGDMAATTGMFKDCVEYSNGFSLPITFVIEDNGFSTNTPTDEVWGSGSHSDDRIRHYRYEREWAHSGFKV